ncbi:hypothetical protein QY702_22320, partial [Xanthomonas campestris pv. plantaginis]|uniref:hypothetical protein n=1 Tax=Xanthomonas campestris TaxID=339 RepID=UPI002B238E37
ARTFFQAIMSQVIDLTGGNVGKPQGQVHLKSTWPPSRRELSAGAAVIYKFSHAPMAASAFQRETVNMRVTDRRDSRPLSTGRDAIDKHSRRGGGAVTERAIDEQAFIRRGIRPD